MILPISSPDTHRLGEAQMWLQVCDYRTFVDRQMDGWIDCGRTDGRLKRFWATIYLLPESFALQFILQKHAIQCLVVQ